MLAQILRSEPAASSREYSAVYGGPEPGTLGESITPVICPGPHAALHSAGATWIPGSMPTVQSLTQCALLAGQSARAVHQPSASQGIAAAALVTVRGAIREPTPLPPQLSPVLPAASPEGMVDQPDTGDDFALSSTTSAGGKLVIYHVNFYVTFL